MSVAEISQLHGRYVRISDKFKAIWTYNQFAAGVYKNFLQIPLPYSIDFQEVYNSIKNVCDVIQTASSSSAAPIMDKSEAELRTIMKQLVEADAPIGPSVLRRFFEKLRRQDEKIIFNLIKFYLYADAVNGDHRDKLDFLFTMLGEDYLEERAEYSMKDTMELRKHISGLLSARPAPPPPPEEVATIVSTVRSIREDIVRATTFESLTDSHLLRRSRELKHSVGDSFFHPDVLIAIIDCNVATKNRFISLYRDEEERILEDARRLLDNEQAIARGFGDTNPELLDELRRFKEFKQVFDDSRANSNVKHNTLTLLKSSMTTILAQLDRGLDESEPEDVSESLFIESGTSSLVFDKLGDDPLLNQYTTRMVSILESFDLDTTHDSMSRSPSAKNLRLEPWEAAAFQKLFWGRPRSVGESDELLVLYLRAAALRLKIEDEAQQLVREPAGVPENELLENTKRSLDRSKEYDRAFNDLLQDGVIHANPINLHRIYRSRLRLLRGFSGLWLIYDQVAGMD